MKVIGKQSNSRMCIICGMDNEYGLKAPFYNMEDGSVATKFSYREQHQSYPLRVHGGMITAMLDEMGLRALWAKQLSEEQFGVTISLETKYRKPVPYNVPLIGRGITVKDSSKFFVVESFITDEQGDILAEGVIKYLKLDVSKIAEGASVHEEMCYQIEDGVKEIELDSLSR